MLTLTLRNLERDGLLTRELFPEVPLRVEYELTTLSRSLLRPMQGLVNWVTENWQQVKGHEPNSTRDEPLSPMPPGLQTVV